MPETKDKTLTVLAKMLSPERKHLRASLLPHLTGALHWGDIYITGIGEILRWMISQQSSFNRS
jgi:hypothetical protein